MLRKKTDSPAVRKPTAFSDTDDEDFTSGSTTVKSRNNNSNSNNVERYPLLSNIIHDNMSQDEPYSDSEVMNVRNQVRRGYQQQIPASWGSPSKYNFGRDNIYKDVILENDVFTDDDLDRDDQESVDEFATVGNLIFPSNSLANNLVKTGRQRKKNAARTKGGEFQSRRKKKRLYFCSVGSEIDVQNLYDHLVSSGILSNEWTYRMYSDVLHIHKPGNIGQVASLSSKLAATSIVKPSPAKLPLVGIPSHNIAASFTPLPSDRTSGSNASAVPADTLNSDRESFTEERMTDIGNSSGHGNGNVNDNHGKPSSIDRTPLQRHLSEDHVLLLATDGAAVKVLDYNQALTDDLHTRISTPGAQEVFVFDFGAIVFWGFPRGDESMLLRTIRSYVTKGAVVGQEFESGEDDMAYVSSPAVNDVTIANDVLLLPEESPAKQRLSVSFAIAQSSVLAIFESRIDRKIVDYKYIPEHMATHGRIELTERRLGTMIGEVFVIRHDVNLHTEILDIPDFFWKDGEKFEGDYKLVCVLYICSVITLLYFICFTILVQINISHLTSYTSIIFIIHILFIFVGFTILGNGRTYRSAQQAVGHDERFTRCVAATNGKCTRCEARVDCYLVNCG